MLINHQNIKADKQKITKFKNPTCQIFIILVNFTGKNCVGVQNVQSVRFGYTQEFFKTDITLTPVKPWVISLFAQHACQANCISHVFSLGNK
jgi:hypothetical protein